MLVTSKNNSQSQNNSQAQASPSSSGGATALISVNTAQYASEAVAIMRAYVIAIVDYHYLIEPCQLASDKVAKNIYGPLNYNCISVPKQAIMSDSWAVSKHYLLSSGKRIIVQTCSYLKCVIFVRTDLCRKSVCMVNNSLMYTHASISLAIQKSFFPTYLLHNGIPCVRNILHSNLPLTNCSTDYPITIIRNSVNYTIHSLWNKLSCDHK